MGEHVQRGTAQDIDDVKTFTISPIVPIPTTSGQAANKSYVDSAVVAGAPDATTSVKGIVKLAGDLAGTAALPTVPGLATKAPLASPTFTGTPAAPTATGGTNTTQLATTAFVTAAIGATSSGITRSIISVTSTTTGAAVSLTDYVYLIGASGAYTQPTAVSNTNKYTLKNVDTTNKTISTTSGQTIDGSATITLTPNTSVDLVSNNSNWKIT